MCKRKCRENVDRPMDHCAATTDKEDFAAGKVEFFDVFKQGQKQPLTIKFNPPILPLLNDPICISRLHCYSTKRNAQKWELRRADKRLTLSLGRCCPLIYSQRSFEVGIILCSFVCIHAPARLLIICVVSRGGRSHHAAL